MTEATSLFRHWDTRIACAVAQTSWKLCWEHMKLQALPECETEVIIPRLYIADADTP